MELYLLRWCAQRGPGPPDAAPAKLGSPGLCCSLNAIIEPGYLWASHAGLHLVAATHTATLISCWGRTVLDRGWPQVRARSECGVRLQCINLWLAPHLIESAECATQS